MRIVILTSGSRGDIQPYVALGLGLQRAGHHVCIAAPDLYEAFISGYGLEFTPIERASDRALSVQVWQEIKQAGGELISTLRHISEMTRSAETMLTRVLLNSWEACKDADAIVCGLLGFAGPHIAERLGIPWCWALLQPISRTYAFPHWFAPRSRWLGAPYNLLTYVIAERVFWKFMRRAVNRWRQEHLGLPSRGRRSPYRFADPRVPVLYGFSPAVIPRPTDWQPHEHVTGYWFLDTAANWRAPDDLVAFLAESPPPVYIGFGSMDDFDSARLLDLASSVLARVQQRGVVLMGPSTVARAMPDNVRLIDSVPFDWLFPQMSVVVHHGGAGTTAIGLRSGIPTVTVPFFSDQPLWGRLVAELEAGPAPIPHREVSAERLGAAVHQALTDQRLRSRVAALGQRLRTEDGVARAVALLDAHLAGGNPQV